MKPIEYFKTMAKDGRMLEVFDNGESVAFITFSICDNYFPYKEKDIWDYLPHDVSGSICFIEKLVCKKWTKTLRKLLATLITSKYPQIEEAIWFRPSNGITERKVTYRVRHETSL